MPKKRSRADEVAKISPREIRFSRPNTDIRAKLNGPRRAGCLAWHDDRHGKPKQTHTSVKRSAFLARQTFRRHSTRSTKSSSSATTSHGTSPGRRRSATSPWRPDHVLDHATANTTSGELDPETAGATDGRPVRSDGRFGCLHQARPVSSHHRIVGNQIDQETAPGSSPANCSGTSSWRSSRALIGVSRSRHRFGCRIAMGRSRTLRWRGAQPRKDWGPVCQRRATKRIKATCRGRIDLKYGLVPRMQCISSPSLFLEELPVRFACPSFLFVLFRGVPVR